MHHVGNRASRCIINQKARAPAPMRVALPGRAMASQAVRLAAASAATALHALTSASCPLVTQGARVRPAARRAGASPPARGRTLQVAASAVPPVAASVSAPPAPAAPAPAPPRAARKPLHVRINDEWYDLSGWRLAHPGEPLPRRRGRRPGRQGCKTLRSPPRVRSPPAPPAPPTTLHAAPPARTCRHLSARAARGRPGPPARRTAASASAPRRMPLLTRRSRRSRHELAGHV